MRWTSLGHACWLIEAAGLRLLCDPLLGIAHHGGVFEVTPRRRLRAEALRPDFIVISHRHTDHFDVPSLATLARLDPDTVVVTPDPLVAETARALGFRSVRQVGAGQRIELDGLMLVTTESLAANEWGLMVATEDGLVWNMVDSVLRDADHAHALARAGVEALQNPSGRVDLVLFHGQPMLEIAAQVGQALSFPFRRYAAILAQLQAIDPGAIVPSAAGTVHVPDYAWLNAIVYPVDEARFCRDAARVCPEAAIFPSQLGARYRLTNGEVVLERADASELIERIDGGPGRGYRPVEIPLPRDPGELDDGRRAAIVEWIHADLRVALARAYPEFGVDRPLRFVLEVVSARAREAWTLTVDAREAVVTPGYDPDWDVYDIAVGSLLADVLAGRRFWGDLLLGGALRGFSRAYELSATKLTRANVAEMFVYYALPYEESLRRFVAAAIERAASAASAPRRPSDS